MKNILACVLSFLTVTARAATPEQELVAAVLIAESGGEGADGLAAVAEVIWTRSAERHQTLTQVVVAKWQFSCLNGADHAKVIAKAKTHPKWPLALKLATERPQTNLTRGSNHYHTPSVHPLWSRGRTPVAKIGGHLFFRL